MKILTSDQIKLAEKLAIESGISQEQLMKNAGLATAAFIEKKIEDFKNKNCVVICGNGNNGGDGYIAASKLYNDYVNVSIISISGDCKSDATKDARQKAESLGIKIISTDDIEKTSKLIEEADILVDAICATGFKGEMTDELKALSILWNKSKGIKFAVDLPTGISSDSGELDKDCFKASFTVSFISLKPAHIMAESKDFCGNIVIADIGIKSDILDKIDSTFFWIDDKMVFENIKVRKKDSHKGNYGSLINISGSNNMIGAAALSTIGALRVGTGLVTLVSTRNVILGIASRILESKFLNLPYNNFGTISANYISQILEELQKSTACLIGCGLGVNEESKLIFNKVLREAQCPVVIDADGLTILSQDLEILKEIQTKVILTPHIGEMARLLGVSIGDILESRYQVITDFAREYNVTIVLKDYQVTIVNEKGEIYINTYGNPGLAKGGSGDILAGMIAGFAAQGVDFAAECGVYLHSRAADRCASKKSQIAMLPSDIIDSLCEIFLEAGR